MQNKEKYFIVDESGKYVVGYVVDGNNREYITYDKTESFAIRPFMDNKVAREYIKHLSLLSKEIGDNHIFTLIEVL